VTGLGVILLVTLFIFGDYSKPKKLFALVGVLFVSSVLLLSGSRMPFIAVSLVLFYTLFKSIRIKKGVIYVNKGLKYFLILIGIGIGLLVFLVKRGLFSTIIYRLQILFTQSNGGDSAGLRFTLYDSARQILVNNPFFGAGFGSFGVEYSGVDQRTYPHNIFLEYLSELGVFGTLLFLVLLVSSVLVLFRNKNSAAFNFRIAVFSCFLYLLLNANVSGDINDNRMLLTFVSLQFLIPLIFNRKEIKLKQVNQIS